jgi:hypothetical protein
MVISLLYYPILNLCFDRINNPKLVCLVLGLLSPGYIYILQILPKTPLLFASALNKWRNIICEGVLCSYVYTLWKTCLTLSHSRIMDWQDFGTINFYEVRRKINHLNHLSILPFTEHLVFETQT